MAWHLRSPMASLVDHPHRAHLDLKETLALVCPPLSFHRLMLILMGCLLSLTTIKRLSLRLVRVSSLCEVSITHTAHPFLLAHADK